MLPPLSRGFVSLRKWLWGVNRLDPLSPSSDEDHRGGPVDQDLRQTLPETLFLQRWDPHRDLPHRVTHVLNLGGKFSLITYLTSDTWLWVWLQCRNCYGFGLHPYILLFIFLCFLYYFHFLIYILGSCKMSFAGSHLPFILHSLLLPLFFLTAFIAQRLIFPYHLSLFAPLCISLYFLLFSFSFVNFNFTLVAS